MRPASRKMLENPQQTLNSVLFLILLSHLVSATLLGIVLDDVLGAAGVLVGLVVEIVLFFVIAEVMPKTYAVQHTDAAALSVAGFLHAITVFGPLRVLSRSLIALANLLLPGKGLKEGPFVTEEDLRAMADVAADEESIEREERQLIHSIFEFGDTVVREVMLPRPDMVAISADATVEEGIERSIEGGFSRIPAYEDTTDNIVGLVYLKDLVGRARAGGGKELVRASLRPAVFVPEQKRVAELLREMQSKQFHMAIVIDEYGGTAGPSPSRTSSRRSWARSPTSTTSRNPVSSTSTTARCACRAECRSTRSARSSAWSCPTPSGTPSAASCSTSSVTFPTKARPWASRGSRSGPSGSRAAGSSRS